MGGVWGEEGREYIIKSIENESIYIVFSRHLSLCSRSIFTRLIISAPFWATAPIARIGWRKYAFAEHIQHLVYRLQLCQL